MLNQLWLSLSELLEMVLHYISQQGHRWHQAKTDSSESEDLVHTLLISPQKPEQVFVFIFQMQLVECLLYIREEHPLMHSDLLENIKQLCIPRYTLVQGVI